MFGIDDALLGGSIAALGSIGGSALSAITGKSAGDREYGRQKEFAQNGITWRVEDAKRAGIHPLFAIGANTPTYSPQAAVGTDYGLSAAGQNIGRAIEAGQTAKQRHEAQETANQVGQAQADYYRALTERTKMDTELLGQRSVVEALQSIRGDTIGTAAANSDRVVRTQQAATPMQSLGRSVGTTNPGVDVLRLGNLFFEVPPQANGDALTENDAIMAAYWAAKEYGSNLTESQVLDSLTTGERKDVLSGLAYLERIPGFGFLLRPTKAAQTSYSNSGRSASGKITHFSHHVTPRKFRFGNHVLSIGPNGINYE